MLTFQDIQHIFEIAHWSEQHAFLKAEELDTLKKIYDICTPSEREELKHIASSVISKLELIEEQESDGITFHRLFEKKK